ncbi:phosphatidylglycerophosphatase A [Candidatus Omnitrophota bacterium]
MRYLHRLVATLFYIGYIPFAPGTVGSLAALFLYYFVKDNLWLFGISIIISLFLGLASAGKVERLSGSKDTRVIIIDEFTGMLLSLYLLPVSIGYIVSAFLLFRFFDIVKPAPIKRLEKLPGGLGIMLDDLMAAVYTNLVLQIVYRLL